MGVVDLSARTEQKALADWTGLVFSWTLGLFFMEAPGQCVLL
jgi:hypothetical protein